MSDQKAPYSIAQALKEAGKRLRELEAEEENTPDVGFCPTCGRDRVIIRKRCAQCKQLLVGSLSIPVDQLSFGSNVTPWSPGDPGTPIGTVVAVDGDMVIVELGGVAEVFREVTS